MSAFRTASRTHARLIEAHPSKNKQARQCPAGTPCFSIPPKSTLTDRHALLDTPHCSSEDVEEELTGTTPDVKLVGNEDTPVGRLEAGAGSPDANVGVNERGLGFKVLCLSAVGKRVWEWPVLSLPTLPRPIASVGHAEIMAKSNGYFSLQCRMWLYRALAQAPLPS